MFNRMFSWCEAQPIIVAVIDNAFHFHLDKPKQLLHEWLHTRYGVFDEYPIADSPIDSQKFYYSSDGLLEAVR